ncbi:MAG: hypothetical protein ABH834_07985 [Candidatus Altiarchaeota archaeon]
MAKHKQKPPEGWSEQDWRLYQEGMAAKKALDKAEESGVPAPEMAPMDERPAAEIVDDFMRSMPKQGGSVSSGRRGPWLEVRRREPEPNPLVEAVKMLWNRIFGRNPKD